MSNLQIILLVVVLVFVGLPALVYLLVKFGAAGYWIAKRRHQLREQSEKKQNDT